MWGFIRRPDGPYGDWCATLTVPIASDSLMARCSRPSSRAGNKPKVRQKYTAAVPFSRQSSKDSKFRSNEEEDGAPSTPSTVNHGKVKLLGASTMPLGQLGSKEKAGQLRRCATAPATGPSLSGAPSRALSRGFSKRGSFNLDYDFGAGAASHTPSSRRLRAGGPEGSNELMISQRPSSSVGRGVRNTNGKSIADRVSIGPVGALEGDKTYQKQLLAQWKKELEEKEGGTRAINRQLCLFFDFLPQNPGGDFKPGVQKYLDEDFGDIQNFEEAARVALPEMGENWASQLNPRQMKSLRQALQLYGQISRPFANAQEVIFRPTFCRFIVDARLVRFDSFRDGRPPYHLSARLFDSVARSGGPGSPLCASLDQCVQVIGCLLARLDLPPNVAWNALEQGLERCERIGQAIFQQIELQAKEKAQGALEDSTDQAILDRRMEMFGKHGSPPQTYTGSLRSWMSGLQSWLEVVNYQSSPACAAERLEQSTAVMNYVKDMMVEPGVLYAAVKFRPIFQDLFSCYCDETRVRYLKVGFGDEASLKKERIPHMSFAAFFRFCLDFALFPQLCSFEEAWEAYRSSDCAQPLGTEENPVNERSALPRPSAGEDDIEEEPPPPPRRRRRRSKQNAEEGGEEDEKEDGYGEGEDLLLTEDSDGSEDGYGEEGRGSSKSSKGSRSTSLVVPPRTPSKPSLKQPEAMTMPVSPLGRRHGNMSQDLGEATTTPMATQGRKTVSGAFIQLSPSQSPVGRRGSSDSVAVSPAGLGTKTLQAFKKSGTSTTNVHEDEAKEPWEAKEEEEDKEETPRVKMTTSFEWVKKPYRSMSSEERSTYAVLTVLHACCSDLFINVRTLFQIMGEHGDRWGRVTAGAVLRVLRLSRVTSDFVENRVQEFLSLVDPHSPDGLLDPAELEKAIEAVRADKQRRQLLVLTTRGPAIARLGEESRRLSSKDPEVLPFPASDEVPVAFGPVAFLESVLLLSMFHMHGSGVPVKCASSGGLKAEWVVAYLHFRFDELMAQWKVQMATEAAAEAEKQKHEEAAQGSDPGSDSPVVSKPLPKGRGLQSTSLESSGSPKSLSSTGTSTTSMAAKLLAKTGVKAKLDKAVSQIASQDVNRHRLSVNFRGALAHADDADWVPSGATYVTLQHNLFKSHPDVFSQRDQTDLDFHATGEECTACGRRPDVHGFGSVFCHTCSGVDSKCLGHTLLQPIFDRHRQRRLLPILRTLDKKEFLQHAGVSGKIIKAAARFKRGLPSNDRSGHTDQTPKS